MGYLSIGEFAARTRLSPKALRLYDELRLVVPASVDPRNGYRRYRADQVEQARLVARLREADMPLAQIAQVLALDGPDAAEAIGAWWQTVEERTGQRRAVVAYLQARLNGKDQPRYDIRVHAMPDRQVAALSAQVFLGETTGFFVGAFARLRATGPGLTGIAGVPYLVFHGEVSADSDGPLELCRPLAGLPASETAAGLEIRAEPAHEEVYTRIALKDLNWPAMRPALDALERWADEHGRRPAGPPRQLLIADQRTASPDTPVCDLALPLTLD
jgi:DNA-binding transcriptional MerR regulator